MENQLAKIITDSGLDKTKSQVLMEQFSNYFEMAAEWENRANALVITSIEQKEEMKLAREGRLYLRDKRVQVEKTRKQLKENSLREGQTIDAIAKIITNLIAPIESNLEEKEKFAEIQEAKRIEKAREDRTKESYPYIEFIPYGIDLGKMDDDNYHKLLNGAKLQMQAKQEAEAKAEAERIENERKLEEDRVARAKAEAEEREKQRLENEKLRKEAEERERQMAEERAKAEAQRKKAEEIARREREEAERKLDFEREQKRKLEAELKAKEDAERQAKLEAERKALEEQRKREAEERKAKNAPDKEKLLEFANVIEAIKYPELLTDDAKKILEVVETDMKNIVMFINNYANRL